MQRLEINGLKQTTRYRCRIFLFGRGWEFFSSGTLSRPVLGPTQHPIESVPRALSLGVKWPGQRMHGAIPPLPQYVFMALGFV